MVFKFLLADLVWHNKIKANPIDYYYPVGAEPRGNAFSNISERYALPASESSLNPNF